MASVQARIVRHVVRRRVRPALGDMSSIERVRRVFNDPLPSPRGVRYLPAVVGGIPGEWVEDERSTPDSLARAPTLLYIHGGGFIGGSPATHRPISAGFASRGFRVFAVDYRLAPEHPFPAPLDDVVTAWRALRLLHDQQSPGQRIVVAGDSAGGNLALALMLALKAAGERLPDVATLFSPSTDVVGESESMEANSHRDAMFHGPSLEHLGRAYIGPDGDATNPLVSPVRGDFVGFPPLLIHVGADEVLRDDGLRVAVKARAAGVHVESVVWPVVTHAWQLIPKLPEARRSMDRAAEFMKTALPRHEQVEHLDTIIVGAGLSGIGAAVHLQEDFPGRRFAILESRAAIGGTWDLFRYPGVRSDSDMYTLGYAFKPWTDNKSLAAGADIRKYVVDTAVEHGIDRQVRFGHRVVRAEWSSADARWTLDVERAPDTGGDAEHVRISCNFLLVCSGYYSYAAGHAPEFAGSADFAGRLVHPQFWPEHLETAGKRIVVIGSGATAVTLVPELAKTAAKVTMLQRSPSYVMSLPSQDMIAAWLRKVLPGRLAYRLARAKNIGMGMLFFKLSRRWPKQVKGNLIKLVRSALGTGHDVDTHFTPRYDPWDQRVCFVPDGDLFDAIKSGRAEVVTDQVDRFTATGIRLASGREIEADIVVSATGLKLNLLGDVAFAIDGAAVDLSKTLAYKAMMFSGVPNLIYTFGYTNASWTLKADLTANYASRLFRYMDRNGFQAATPHADASIVPQPFLDFSSGYVQRAVEMMPKQGSKAPWRLAQNYVVDLLQLRHGRIDDGTLRFSRTAAAPAPPAVSPSRAAAGAPGRS